MNRYQYLMSADISGISFIGIDFEKKTYKKKKKSSTAVVHHNITQPNTQLNIISKYSICIIGCFVFNWYRLYYFNIGLWFSVKIVFFFKI